MRSAPIMPLAIVPTARYTTRERVTDILFWLIAVIFVYWPLAAVAWGIYCFIAGFRGKW